MVNLEKAMQNRGQRKKILRADGKEHTKTGVQSGSRNVEELNPEISAAEDADFEELATDGIEDESDEQLRQEALNRINIYSEPGVIFYFKRMFSRDADIVRRLEAVGAMHELSRLNTENNNTTIEKPADADRNFSSLIDNINDYCHSLREKTDPQWHSLEKQIKRYFKTDEYIYEYIADKTCNKRGYYIDTSNSLLKYSNGDGKAVTVGTFNPNDRTNLELFKKILNPSFSDAMTLGARNMKLNPELFMHLIMHVQSLTSAPRFCVGDTGTEFKVTKQLMSKIDSLQARYKAKVATDRLSVADEYRTLDKMTAELTENLELRIRNYLKTHTTDQDYETFNPNDDHKINLMKASLQYLHDGNAAKFGQRVNQYRGWVAWFKGFFSWTSEAYQILNEVRGMKSSPFLRESLKEMIKVHDTASEPFNFAKLSQLDVEPQKEIITKNWKGYTVPKEDCLRAIASLREVLEAEKFEYPDVILPENVLKRDDDVSAGMTTHLLYLFTKMEEEIQDDHRDGINFADSCAALQSKILEMLAVQYVSPNGRVRVGTEVLTEYNTLGDKLCKKLCEVAITPSVKATQIVSILKLKQEVNRILTSFETLMIECNKIQRNFDDLQQTTVSNYLDKYMKNDLTELMSRLRESREFLNEQQDRDFDFLDGSISDAKLLRVKDIISDIGNPDLSVAFGILKRIVMTDCALIENNESGGHTVDNIAEEHPRAREYINTFSSDSETSKAYKERQQRFNSIMAQALAMFDKLGVVCHSLNLSAIVVKETQAKEAVRVSSSGMFKASGNQEPRDDSNSEILRISRHTDI